MSKWIWLTIFSILFISSAFAIEQRFALNMSGYMHQTQHRALQSLAKNDKLEHKINTDFNDLKLDIEKTDKRFTPFFKNPTIAYLLILIAVYAIFFELKTPGSFLPGLLGIVALGIALYSFNLLHINNLGLTLLLIGICFMVIEVSEKSFGIIGISGLLAFIVGSSILYTLNEYTYHLSFGLILAMSVVTVAFFIMVTTLGYKKKVKHVRSK